MLLEFKCSNHKSIKEEVTFSMLAGSDNTSEELLREYGNFRVLRSAVIYGANGSGKSNFLSALGFMKGLVVKSISHQPGDRIVQFPHKLSAKGTPSEYKIQFIKDNIRYAYGFSLVNNVICREYLYFFPEGDKVKIFEREGIKVKEGDNYKRKFGVSLSTLKDNRLFLSCAANYSDVRDVEKAFLFFRDDIVMYSPYVNNWTEYSMSVLQEDDALKKECIEILRSLGTGIKDLKTSFEQLETENQPKEVQLSDDLRMVIQHQSTNKMEAKVVYDEFQVDLLKEESKGMQRLFQMLCPLLDIMKKGKVLICDELETSLHEIIICHIVKLFYNFDKEKFAQLIFSTHNSSLLEKDLFRRDQIWFTQLSTGRATELYSLAEFRDVRRTENVGKGYIAGKYGAIPMLNSSWLM